MADKYYTTAIAVLRKNGLAAVLSAAALGLAFGLQQPLRRLPDLVDWDTIAALSALLLITTGIKESGLFYLAACRISRKIHNERFLALFLVSIAAIFSMFLTNDIALFIVVPLILSLQQISNTDLSKLIVFAALAVNVGSSLTPIGNPQNIFLWRHWGVSFPAFIREMAPLVLVMALCLFAFILACFSSRTIETVNSHHPAVDQRLFYLSAVLLIIFIASVELHAGKYFLGLAFFSMALMRRKIILKTDWGLIFLFIIIFINLNLTCRFDAVQKLLSRWNYNIPSTLFLSGALMSQAISNVPAAILLANHTSHFKMIAYGVNVGGNGLLTGSFANFIALRFIHKRSKYLLFHIYSLPFFAAALVSVYYLL